MEGAFARIRFKGLNAVQLAPERTGCNQVSQRDKLGLAVHLCGLSAPAHARLRHRFARSCHTVERERRLCLGHPAAQIELGGEARLAVALPRRDRGEAQHTARHRHRRRAIKRPVSICEQRRCAPINRRRHLGRGLALADETGKCAGCKAAHSPASEPGLTRPAQAVDEPLRRFASAAAIKSEIDPASECAVGDRCGISAGERQRPAKASQGAIMAEPQRPHELPSREFSRHLLKPQSAILCQKARPHLPGFQRRAQRDPSGLKPHIEARQGRHGGKTSGGPASAIALRRAMRQQCKLSRGERGEPQPAGPDPAA